MTRLLQDTMRERAEHVEGPRLDLDAVMAAGDRRRRRRGSVVVVSAAVACALVGLGAVQVAGTSDGAETPGYLTTDGFVDHKVTYATGSTIHYGDEQIDTRYDIYSFVQTDSGFVFTDEAGTVYLADGSSVEEIGAGAKSNELRADGTGSYVAWVDESVGPRELVAYDTRSRSEAMREHARGGSVSLVAVDGENVYAVTGRAFKRFDIGSGRAERLRKVRESFTLTDVEDGWILRQLNRSYNHEGSVPLGTVMSRDPKADEPRIVAGARDLSPDARYVSTDFDDSERVFDTQSGEEVELDTAEYDFQALSEWVDGDTATVMTLTRPYSDPDVSLLICEIPLGTCEVAVDGLSADIQLPVGENVFDE